LSRKHGSPFADAGHAGPSTLRVADAGVMPTVVFCNTNADRTNDRREMRGPMLASR
jgi:hypothetical protein